MTSEEINALFAKKNLIEVLSYTITGLGMLIDEIPNDTQQEFSTSSDAVELRALITVKDLVKKKLVELLSDEKA